MIQSVFAHDKPLLLQTLHLDHQEIRGNHIYSRASELTEDSHGNCKAVTRTTPMMGLRHTGPWCPSTSKEPPRAETRGCRCQPTGPPTFGKHFRGFLGCTAYIKGTVSDVFGCFIEHCPTCARKKATVLPGQPLAVNPNSPDAIIFFEIAGPHSIRQLGYRHCRPRPSDRLIRECQLM